MNDLRLAIEAPDRRLVPDQANAQELDRHPASRLDVLRAIHGAETSTSQQLVHRVATGQHVTQNRARRGRGDIVLREGLQPIFGTDRLLGCSPASGTHAPAISLQTGQSPMQAARAMAQLGSLGIGLVAAADLNANAPFISGLLLLQVAL